MKAAAVYRLCKVGVSGMGTRTEELVCEGTLGDMMQVLPAGGRGSEERSGLCYRVGCEKYVLHASQRKPSDMRGVAAHIAGF